MLTTRAAARLLSPWADPAPLATALGFGPLHPLDRGLRHRFGLDDETGGAHVASGAGSLRLLALTVTGRRPPRERVAAVCRQLAREAPDKLWLVLATTNQRVVLAAPAPGGGSPVAALEFDPRALRESDAETVAALAGSLGALDLVVHLRWRETLGRDAIGRRFYRELRERVEQLVASADGAATPDERRTIALLHASRLLFLSFVEARGWLDGDREFLRGRFAERCGGRGAHVRFLEPLFFGTLNTPVNRRATAARAFGRIPFLNGGLFTRTPIEGRRPTLRFGDAALADLIGGLLTRFRLTARETTAEWSDAAVDPEMLGRAFESLMHPDARRAQGAFYTPPPLIARLTGTALGRVLALRDVPAETIHAAYAGAVLLPPSQRLLATALRGVRVLDPACGSGAFLVYALETLATLHRAAGDARTMSTVRRDVLTHSIFGVDRNPTAVWLCQLRLWLSVVVDDATEDPLQLAPLPNLDRNVREGDALAGPGLDDVGPRVPAAEIGLRLRYARATGGRKRTLGRALDHVERRRALALLEGQIARLTASRRELLIAARSPDLFRARRGLDRMDAAALSEARSGLRSARAAHRALREGGALPFAFATHFPEAAAAGGFSLVVGNPPWVRTHAIPAAERDALRARYTVYRRAAWYAGAQLAAAGPGFASQADLAALFTERAVRLTSPSGVIALLLPAKLWIALAGGGVRELLAAETTPVQIESWLGGTGGFDAAVYPSALVAQRAVESARDVRVVAHRGDAGLAWNLARGRLALDASPGAPWLLLPPDVREAFDAVARAGAPLAASPFGRPMLGVKCGCNAAFIVGRDDPARHALDRSYLRPLLRAEDLRAFAAPPATERDEIIWSHDAVGAPLRTLPPDIRRHLGHWRSSLERRSDGRSGPWWSLFRTDAARSDRPRVVWGDIGRAPRAMVLAMADPTVPLNTCYVVTAETESDAYALATLLNSPLGVAWLAAVAEPARGGYRRFLGWTTARFPLPRDWGAVRDPLAAVGRKAARGRIPDRWSYTALALDAYGLGHDRVAPLLSWHFLQ